MSHSMVPYCVFASAVADWGIRRGVRSCVPPARGDFGCLYIARTELGMIKVGFSQNVERRVKTLPRTFGKPELVFVVPDVFWSVEHWFHRSIAHLDASPRAGCEWYEETGPIGELIDVIQQLRAVATGRAPSCSTTEATGSAQPATEAA